MKIGIFGGTFDPPHNSHLLMAREAVRQLGLDKLYVLPCGDPPHKSCFLDKEERLAMCRAAFGDFADVDDYEIRKSGKSYTVETLRHYRELYPDAELYLVIGGDSLLNFATWYQPREIAGLAVLAVADRGKQTSVATVRRAVKLFGAKITFINVDPTSLSSTEIRLRYRFGLDASQFVPTAVDEYVRRRGLYAEYRSMAEKLRAMLREERYLHTFYVVKRGLELCNDDEWDKTYVACLLHDCAKYLTESDYARYGFQRPDGMPESVVHSFLGAEVAKRDFGVTDTDVLNAIAYHTTGRPAMSRLEKIVYVADKTEDSRPYPLSHLKRGSLDEQFVACLKEAYEVCLQRHCDSVCPLSEQTLRYYCADYMQKQTELNMTNKKDSEQIVQQICKILADKQAADIKIVEIRSMSDIADYFVICSGRSIPQVKAIFDNLEEQMEKAGKFALRKEGYSEGRWIAVDYGDVIVHVFHKDTREVYGLDNLWNNGSNVTLYNPD